MNKTQFKEFMHASFKKGTLLTNKHNPEYMGLSHPKDRSVLSFELADNLEAFIKSEEYIVTEYAQPDRGKNHPFYEIQPTNSTFSVPTSGVPAHSQYATEALDRLVLVVSEKDGPHLFGGTAKDISKKAKSGDLVFKKKIE